MRSLSVFETISVDGFFCDAAGDMSFAHCAPDAEFDTFTAANAGSGGALVMGRVTHDLMASFWPMEMAQRAMPQVAAGMNAMRKLVFSRSLSASSWQNTQMSAGPVADIVAGLKQQDGPDLTVLGSGSIVAQLAAAGLVDRYQFVIAPVALGSGRSLFAGLDRPVPLTLLESRAFPGGKIVATYRPG